ncbi:LysR family transcriptional regulator [Haliovirga abyssi]|uniref:LysR family transcriptional regulator n=1 Tax=Haliovirga abyssi TaxID=2996794 RepID=A0AAU9D8L2_9FUSO|nr:LysR family transcriptional regulator [Haliovirga abyssi]BDU49926.1 LysR family transcriptional regulator [Haliovirga abyssi]
MDLHHLKIFYYVATEKSFTKAANKLYINQSAVSIQIKKFEDNLGVKLFDRSEKKIKLTYAGDTLFKIADDIFKNVKRAEKEIEKVVSDQKGKLVIGATHIIGEPLLPKIIMEIKESYPGMEFEIHIQERDILLDMLKEGNVDIVLMGDFFINDKSYSIIPIADYPFILINKYNIEDKNDLEKIPLISRDDSLILEKNLVTLERKYNIQIKNRFKVNGSIETVKNLVIEGIGYTILPYYCVYKEIKNKELQVVENFDKFKIGYQAVILRDRMKDIDLIKFIDFIKLFKIEKEL